MSLPARRLDTPPPVHRPRRAPSRPARAPAPAPETRTRRAPRSRRSPAFVVFASALVGSMVFGIVVLNVLLAQASFRIEATERHIEELQTEHRELVREQATLSAPRRIAAWAARHGMRLPDDIRILHAPGALADPAGADTLPPGGDRSGVRTGSPTTPNPPGGPAAPAGGDTSTEEP